ncbi:MAG: type II toxin-antitoxin system RelE/ParE family toxin [Streptosporangiales bacterium]|nr:type II toxin-antitoxin system RelE/ParE family toxin [Streptosporangiales bacterium]
MAEVGDGGAAQWEILLTTEVEAFFDELYESDAVSHQLVNQAVLVLERNGPSEGRPLVGSIAGSKIANMKELRPPSTARSEVRILLVFDPWRSAILLVAGDKAGQWAKWYRRAIPRAERLYDQYLAERKKEEEDAANE